MVVAGIRAATRDDARYIGARLRAQDRREIAGLRMGKPADMVLLSWDLSKWSRVYCVDGVPACIFGVSPSSMAGVDLPWLLGTERMRSLGPGFVRSCRPVVDEMLAGAHGLVNFVHSRNGVAIRWLRWLGFTLLPGSSILSGAFVPFYMEREGHAGIADAYFRSCGLVVNAERIGTGEEACV